MVRRILQNDGSGDSLTPWRVDGWWLQYRGPDDDTKLKQCAYPSWVLSYKYTPQEFQTYINEPFFDISTMRDYNLFDSGLVCLPCQH